MKKAKQSKYVILKDGPAFRVCYRAYGLTKKGIISAPLSEAEAGRLLLELRRNEQECAA